MDRTLLGATGFSLWERQWGWVGASRSWGLPPARPPAHCPYSLLLLLAGRHQHHEVLAVGEQDSGWGQRPHRQSPFPPAQHPSIPRDAHPRGVVSSQAHPPHPPSCKKRSHSSEGHPGWPVPPGCFDELGVLRPAGALAQQVLALMLRAAVLGRRGSSLSQCPGTPSGHLTAVPSHSPAPPPSLSAM